MFYSWYNTFFLEAQFRTKEYKENGTWAYFYRNTFNLITHSSYRKSFSEYIVSKSESSGRPTLLYEEVVENTHQRVDVSPNKSLRRLSI